ncbi:MAG: ABC transporter permease [Anaerolineaceae bacterium]|nr:ABC transporter permease [Anaerolineaceae bacterium]
MASETVYRLEEETQEQLPSQSFWRMGLRRLMKNPLAIIGFSILFLEILVAIFATQLAPYDPYEPNYANNKAAPSAEHIFGTDHLGRDVFSRVLQGSRISLPVGLGVVSIAVLLGVPWGAAVGYFGGLFDMGSMRLVDLIQAFPLIVLAIVVIIVWGTEMYKLMIVLGFVFSIQYTRLVRGVVLSLREEEYTLAARAMGASHIRILFQHLIPNLLNVVVVLATFHIPEVILLVAALSYLGLGAQPPSAEWGAMLNGAKNLLRFVPMVTIAPGVAIMITLLAVNFIGDALRDALDPTLRN